MITTDAGYVAVGGRFADRRPDGSTGWESAVLTSPDGTDWTVRQTFDGVDIGSVAARGALIVATTDAASLVVSRDSGATWHQILAGGIGFGTGSPTAVGVLGNGRWVAVGTAGPSAAAWSSADGLTWEAATMEAADPVAGIQSVTPYAIAAGTSMAIAAGTDDPTDCAPGDDFCGHWGTGWTTQDGLNWMRLQRGTPLTEGTGAFIWPAGDAGVLAAGMGLSQSSNGWTWTTVSGDSTAVLPLAIAFRGRTMVAAGLGMSPDKPGATIWVGTIAEP